MHPEELSPPDPVNTPNNRFAVLKMLLDSDMWFERGDQVAAAAVRLMEYIETGE